MNQVMRPLVLLLAAWNVYAQSSADVQNKAVAMQQEAIGSRMRASLMGQVASVRRQAKLSARSEDAFLVTGEVNVVVASPTSASECDPLPPMRVGKLIADAAQRTGVSPGMLREVMREESAFRPCAVSTKGARGLMQLMPSVIEDFGVSDAFDPEQNVSAGAALLKQLMDRYAGDLNRVLGAYNAGPARVDASGGLPPFPETRRYVSRILSSLDVEVP